MESNRIKRLQRTGQLPADSASASCPSDDQQIGLLEARTAFGIAVTDDIDMPTIRTNWLIVGVVVGILYKWMFDHDVAGLRRSRKRRWILVGCGWILLSRLAVNDEDKSHSFGLGTSVGALCYRINNGLLNDIPGT